MAYQNVGTPKFYIDNGLFLNSSGVIDLNPIQYLNPTIINRDYQETNKRISVVVDSTLPTDYVAVLGHNCASATHSVGTGIHITVTGSELSALTPSGWNPVVNAATSNGGAPPYDGFSIITFDELSVAVGCSVETPETFITDDSLYANCISIGKTYTPPHSPDLSLTLTRDYSGIKTIETKGGASLSNAFYTKPPNWGQSLGAWELGDSSGEHGIPGTPEGITMQKSGRRAWDLKFSYMDDGDLWGSNQMLSKAINTFEGLEADDHVGGMSPLGLEGNIINGSPGPNGYETFDGESTTGFHGGHTPGNAISKASTPDVLSVVAGLQYIVTFNATLASGVLPTVDIEGGDSTATGVIIITDEGLVDVEGSFTGGHRAVEGANSVVFTVNTTDSTASIMFRHTFNEVSSDFTISDISIWVDIPIEFKDNLLTDDNFFSQVWHKTLGGTLPFIFQPDSSNDKPDQFAICKFKDNSLKATQSAFNVYDISLSIEEVW